MYNVGSALFVILPVVSSVSTTWVVRTTSACTTDGSAAYIGGPQCSSCTAGEDEDGCKAVCNLYEWCKGIRFDFGSCRLLTDDLGDWSSVSATLGSDWVYYNQGSWVEPNLWQGSTTAPQYTCFEKQQLVFTSHRFVTGNGNSRYGASASQLTSAYSNVAWASDPTFFKAADPFAGYQKWVVPESAMYKITAAGAQGASDGQTCRIGSAGGRTH